MLIFMLFKIEDKEKELQMHSERIASLEEILAKRQTEQNEMEKRLRREMDILQSKNAELENKLIEAASIVGLFKLCIENNLLLINIYRWAVKTLSVYLVQIILLTTITHKHTTTLSNTAVKIALPVWNVRWPIGELNLS